MEEKIGFKEVFMILAALFLGFFVTMWGVKYNNLRQQQRADAEFQQYLEELNYGK
jgi:preprotein translocase subunit YajC